MTSNSNKPLRGAIIGFGFIAGKGHVPAYLQRKSCEADVEIVAVCDICDERRYQAREALPDARIYPTAEALLEQEMDAIDFVDICTPPCNHTKIALSALDKGLHVLCEKPLTTTVEEARQLLVQAKKVGRVLFPVHNYKHAPVVKAIDETIRSGKLGKIRSVSLTTFRNTHAKGVPEWKTDWRRSKQFSGGGIAMDHGSHSFYLTFDWLNSYPTAITAKMNTLEPGYDTEDNFSCVLSFPSGYATLQLTWTAGVRKVLYCIQGENGAITVDDDDIQIATMQTKKGGSQNNFENLSWDVERHILSSKWMDSSHVSWFNSLFDQFRRAIAKGDFVSKETQEAYRCIEIISSAYQSAKFSSQEVPIPGNVPV